MSITSQDKLAIIEIVQNALQATTQPNLHHDVLIDTVGAGQILNIPPSTLVKWRSTGEVQIPFIRINRQIKYRTTDLLAYIESHTYHKKTSLAA